MRSLGVALVLFSVLALAPPLSQSPAEAASANNEVIAEGRPVGEGQVVARGTRVGTKCLFGDELELTQVSDGETDWAAIRIRDNCDVTLVAVWDGKLSNAPNGIFSDKLNGTESLTSFEETSTSETDLELSGLGVDAVAVAACSTHSIQIIMYGYGGPTDRLTRLVGRMVACESATTFTSVTHTGTCYATNPPGGWTWLTERCYSGGIIQSSTTAQTIEFGDFHCDPRSMAPCSATNPDGYDHTLKTTERKIRGGRATCTGSLTGLDVVASYTDVVVGCT